VIQIGAIRAVEPNMKTPKLGREAMAAIRRELRLLYREIIVEGVPERFAAILRRLDEPVAGGLGSNGPPPERLSKDAPQAGGDGEGPNGGQTHESVMDLTAVASHDASTPRVLPSSASAMTAVVPGCMTSLGFL
jgi:anti-sigma factor NepR-like protein